MEYKFIKPIEDQLKLFARILRSEKLSPETIRMYRNYTGLFLKWISDEKLEMDQVRYNEMMSFINYLTDQQYSMSHINRILIAIRHYCRTLEIKNPAAGIFLRGVTRELPGDLLEKSELVELYNEYQTFDLRTKRNKVILGLYVFQAITTGEQQRLEPSHIKLREGKIYVPGYRSTNARVLKLEASQLLEMQEYLLVIRKEMLEFNIERSGRKPNQIDPRIYDRLFFSELGSVHLKNTIHHLFRGIKKRNPKIRNATQIRQSVIANWLKEKDVRLVQYMAGHRYVSSTERYQILNLQELKDGLDRYHPLG